MILFRIVFVSAVAILGAVLFQHFQNRHHEDEQEYHRQSHDDTKDELEQEMVDIERVQEEEEMESCEEISKGKNKVEKMKIRVPGAAAGGGGNENSENIRNRKESAGEIIFDSASIVSEDSDYSIIEKQE